jgi:hypothetical protein
MSPREQSQIRSVVPRETRGNELAPSYESSCRTLQQSPHAHTVVWTESESRVAETRTGGRHPAVEYPHPRLGPPTVPSASSARGNEAPGAVLAGQAKALPSRAHLHDKSVTSGVDDALRHAPKPCPGLCLPKLRPPLPEKRWSRESLYPLPGGHSSPDKSNPREDVPGIARNYKEARMISWITARKTRSYLLEIRP